jgi:hypothetical protein
MVAIFSSKSKRVNRPRLCWLIVLHLNLDMQVGGFKLNIFEGN